MSGETGLHIEDERHDRRYFTTVPNVVDDLCDNPFDPTVYRAMLRCSGGIGKECFASTRRLAEMSHVSVGQISKSKQRLLELGFIAFVAKKPSPRGGQPIDHYKLVDLWPLNMQHYSKRSPHEHLECSPDEQERSPHERKCSPGETKKGRSRKEEVVKKTSAAKPRFPAEHYRQVEKAYSEIKGIQPNGDEWGPIQRDIKLMFKAGNSPEQIIACMHALEDSEQPWTDSWTVKTVRMKLPEFRAGKLFGGNGRNADRIRALKDDIAEIDRYLEYQIEGRLVKLGWKDGDLSLEESEEKERLERIRSEKQAERAELAKQLRGLEVSSD